jgi:LPPG:FO 2-phospho-L-lactate transferase
VVGRERATPDVGRVEFRGAEVAAPAPGVVDAILAADVVVVAPSNPVVSVSPILAVPGIREALSATSARVVGVSPIIGGRVVRGMAHRLLPAVGCGVDAGDVARWYGARSDGGLLDAWVLDLQDRAALDRVQRLGLDVTTADTLLDDPEVAARLARTVLDLAGTVGAR